MNARSHIGGLYPILNRRDIYRLYEIIDQCADVGGGGIELLTDKFTEDYEGNIEAMPPEELVEWLEYPFRKTTTGTSGTLQQWLREEQKHYSRNQNYGSEGLEEIYICIQDLKRIRDKARTNYNRWYK